MANIKPYQIGSLPNRVLGTPGVDQSAGDAELTQAKGTAQLAGATEGLRNQQASIGQTEAVAGAGALGAIIGGGLRLAGAAVNSYRETQAAQRKAAAAQQQMHANMDAAAAGYKYGSTTNNYVNQAKQEFINNPEKAQAAIEQQLNGLKDDRLQDFPEGTEEWYRARNHFDEKNSSALKEVSDWASAQRQHQAEKLVPAIVDDTNTKIEQQTGTIEERVANFKQQTQTQNTAIAQTEPTLGKQAIDIASMEARQKNSVTLFGNLVEERPAAPMEQLGHLGRVKDMLRDSVKGGYEVPDKDKHTLFGRIEAYENDALKELELKEASTQIDNTVKIESFHFDLFANKDDAGLQRRAIDFAISNKKFIDNQITDLNKSNLPEKAKLVAKKSLEVQVKQLEGVLRTAHANENRIAADKRGDIAESKHWAAESAKAEKAKETEAKAQLAEMRRDKQLSLNDQYSELQTLMGTLSKDNFPSQRKEILSRMRDIRQEAHAAGIAKELTPAQAAKYEAAVSRTQNLLADFHGDWTGTLWASLNRYKDNQAAQKQANLASIIKEVNGVASEMKQEQRHEVANKVAGFTPAQSADFDRRSASIVGSLKSQNASQQAIDFRLNQLRQKILHEGIATKGRGPS